MSLPKYSEYKNSGVPWLGEVPKHWNTKPLKILATINDDALSEQTPPDFDISYVDIGNVSLGAGIERTEPFTFGNAPSRARRLVRDGDVIVSTVRTYLKAIAPVSCPPENMVVSTGFAVVRPSTLLDSGFAKYALQSETFVHQIISRSTGVSYPAISASDLARIELTCPSKPEQTEIAAFLDRETGKIDALIAEQEKLLALLAEKRQATISHAVTRGLNPNSPMKDSGVTWLGAVPAHWSVVRIKDVAKLESGHTPSKKIPEYWENCDIPWVSLNDSKQLAIVDYISKTAVNISVAGLQNSSARLLPPDTVVFTRDATIGLAAIITTTMAVSQHLIAWCPSPRIDSLYLLRVFNFLRPHLDSLTFGATLKTIGMDEVRQLVTPLPSIDEQREIVRFISSEIKKVDELNRSSERAIALLNERRSALITAAVTGKIDVRSSGDDKATPVN